MISDALSRIAEIGTRFAGVRPPVDPGALSTSESTSSASLSSLSRNAPSTTGAATSSNALFQSLLLQALSDQNPNTSTDSSPPSLAATGSQPYAALFSQASAQYGLPAGLLPAIAQVESNYNPNAQSSAGAQGMMQFMPSTAAAMGVNPYDPASAIDGAARLMSGHLQQFGSLPLALAAYNAGSGAVQKYGSVPPYPETQSYVAKVLSLMSQLGNGVQ